MMKTKRGVIWSEMVWWIIALAVLALVIVALVIMRARGMNIIETIKQLFRF